MLPAPMEILEVNDGESVTIHIIGWTKDQGIIRPAHAPAGKAIDILRVHVPPEDKLTFPRYWDVTGLGTIAQLEPLLAGGNFKDRAFKISAFGVGPKKRYSVEIV
jgi:hypothetical protein